MDILLITAAIIFLIVRQGPVGVVVLAYTWLAAAAFNPPITSNVVWFIGCVAGYIAAEAFLSREILS